MRVATNTYRPPYAEGLAGTSTGATQAGAGRRNVDQQLLIEYLEGVGTSNPEFRTSTAGHAGGPVTKTRMRRGYIRRANPNNPANPLSNTVLRFMYNPEQVTRDYLSYTDTAAIDPFNTIFQSGNLVNAPSMVSFTFSLVFDREIEAAASPDNRGVMVDYDFFDMVVRNVSPQDKTTSDVPDNGVMMVNPEDIVVVFGPELAAQGRPTNSQVSFTKFNSLMTPTRMEISITMMLNYFGPIRDNFTLSGNQQIKTYESLIPYTTDQEDIEVQALVQSWAEVEARTDLYTRSLTGGGAATPWWGAGADGGGVGGMVGPVNGDLQTRALALAKQTFVNTRYSQAKRTQVPHFADCSSLVGWCYAQLGASSVFGSAWPTTAGMMQHWQSTNFSTMSLVASWAKGSAQGANIISTQGRPGDILWRKGHVAFLDQGGDFAARSANSSPQVGYKARSAASLARDFTHLLRPRVAGQGALAVLFR